VHHVMILGNDQCDAQFFNIFIYIFKKNCASRKSFTKNHCI